MRGGWLDRLPRKRRGLSGPSSSVNGNLEFDLMGAVHSFGAGDKPTRPGDAADQEGRVENVERRDPARVLLLMAMWSFRGRRSGRAPAAVRAAGLRPVLRKMGGFGRVWLTSIQGHTHGCARRRDARGRPPRRRAGRGLARRGDRDGIRRGRDASASCVSHGWIPPGPLTQISIIIL